MVPLGFGLQHRIVEATRDDRRHIRMIGAASEDQVEAVIETEPKIGDEDIRSIQRDEVLRFVERSRFFDAISSRFEQPHGARAICWTGIDDQNRTWNRHLVVRVTPSQCMSDASRHSVNVAARVAKVHRVEPREILGNSRSFQINVVFLAAGYTAPLRSVVC